MLMKNDLSFDVVVIGGGKHSVKYNPITKKWTYGTRCKRTIYHDKFCKTH